MNSTSKKIEFLGHVISWKGIATDPNKCVKKIYNNFKAYVITIVVFVKHFSFIAISLHNLIK